MDKENIEKKLQKKKYKGVDAEFRNDKWTPGTPQTASPTTTTPRGTQEPVLRSASKREAPPVPDSPKPKVGSPQMVSGSGRPTVPPPTPDARKSLPPPPPLPTGSGHSPAVSSPPISDERMSALPPPPPVPISARTSPGGSETFDDAFPPPPPPPPVGVSSVTKRRTNRLSRLTMPPPRVSVCIIDQNLDDVNEDEELAMPSPPPKAMAPPPPPPLPPPEAALPAPPPMESGFALRSEPTRQPSQKQRASRGDLLASIRKGRFPSLSFQSACITHVSDAFTLSL